MPGPFLPLLSMTGFLLSTPAAAAPLAPLDYDPSLSLAPLVERLGPAVVNLSVEQDMMASIDRDDIPRWLRPYFDHIPDEHRTREGQGSGFLISKDGYILTNNHVIANATELTVRLSDEREYSGRVVGTDARTDVALVKIDADETLPFAPLGDSETLAVGDWVVAIGNPFGLSHTVTSGIISAKGRVLGAGPYDDFLQTDASINPGNSGGPLFDLSGQVVGINTAINPYGQNIGFAIPVDMVKEILDELKTNGKVQRGWIGVGLQDLDPQIAEELDLPPGEGVLLSAVFDDTPAASAGLRAGDVLRRLDGEIVTDTGELVRRIGSLRPGDKVRVEVLRSGRTKTITVTLGARPSEDSMVRGSPSAPERDEPDITTLDDLGVSLGSAKELTGESVNGVLVVRVSSGGRAAGQLRAGDLITDVNTVPVRTPADVEKALSGSGKTDRFVVRRRGNEVLVLVSR